MPLQYVKNNSGETTAVLISIEDWKRIKGIYPNIEDENAKLPQWQKDLIDSRLSTITNNPGRLRSGDELLQELENEE